MKERMSQFLIESKGDEPVRNVDLIIEIGKPRFN
jgi:hypothetical protein